MVTPREAGLGPPGDVGGRAPGGTRDRFGFGGGGCWDLSRSTAVAFGFALDLAPAAPALCLLRRLERPRRAAMFMFPDPQSTDAASTSARQRRMK